MEKDTIFPQNQSPTTFATHVEESNEFHGYNGNNILQSLKELWCWLKTSKLVILVFWATLLYVFFFVGWQPCRKCLCPAGYNTIIVQSVNSIGHRQYGYAATVWCTDPAEDCGCAKYCADPMNPNATGISFSKTYSQCQPKTTDEFYNDSNMSVDEPYAFYSADAQNISVIGVSVDLEGDNGGKCLCLNAYTNKTIHPNQCLC